MDPITAVTHADPYPYYASLRTRSGLAFDPRLGMWLASSAAAVAAVLAHPECRVRPAHEPVPRGIADGAAGTVFGQLMRMNDGERQRCPRAAVEPGLLAEVQRHDPPVQNTRRFVAAPCRIAGMTLEPGAVVLVLLASANRDPQLNPEPDRLLLEREDRRSFSFGSGRHQCPGQPLALSIASAVVGALLRQTTLDQPIAWTYKPSLNGRIPLFTPLPESH
ncbi:hypothetical protein TRE132_24800 [Pseudomonas chlororaphis subsp. aurantiaca]|nr:hypothetical protein TRE132_24800 [Pseudomonas chlororaphis subsp. aurantiaca]